jgi:hypothetical protein
MAKKPEPPKPIISKSTRIAGKAVRAGRGRGAGRNGRNPEGHRGIKGGGQPADGYTAMTGIFPGRQGRCFADSSVSCSHDGPTGSGKVGVGDTGLGADAEAGRSSGLGEEAELGRGEDSEFFERTDCSISCSFAISRVMRSWSAVSWSSLSVICS